MYAYVDEGAEFGDVGDDSLENHAWLEVTHLVDAFGEPSDFELVARITTRFGDLGDDVLYGWQAALLVDIIFRVEL